MWILEHICILVDVQAICARSLSPGPTEQHCRTVTALSIINVSLLPKKSLRKTKHVWKLK
jgi:hypothetical protein